jgi:predicted Zn-dependent protease
MKSIVMAVGVAAVLMGSSPAEAQLTQLGKAFQKAQQAVDEITFTDAEEHDLGSAISEKLRDKYGVVQDPAVHKYVTLVGTVLAQSSSRPTLGWTFIVLDTDGVNAFAAPGGFIHITRGALALIENEAELADVLGHEISHVTGKHTIKAIQKAKVIQGGASLSRSQVIAEYADRGYEMIVENAFDRGDEMDADKNGVTLANSVGYAPSGLSAFLRRLSDRNKDLKDRSGLFASHPETTARLDGLAKVVIGGKLVATAVVTARYRASISYRPVPVATLAEGTPGAEAKPADSKPAGSKFGLAGLNPLAKDKSSSQTIASAGSRGVNPDRDAKGGANNGLVVVIVTPAEVAAFRQGISG